MNRQLRNHFDDLVQDCSNSIAVQDCSNSIADALDLLQSWTKPSIYGLMNFHNMKDEFLSDICNCNGPRM